MKEDKKFFWIKKTHKEVLYSEAFDPLIGFIGASIGAITYSERNKEYEWNQRITIRNLDSETLREVLKRLEELNK